jgi:hypothetical protein
VSETSLRALAFLSVQRALVGAVSPEIRAVSIDLSQGKIIITVYHNGQASDDLYETVAVIVTEVLADFREGQEVVSSVVRVDEPESVPLRGEPAFAVKGTTFR